MTDPRLSPPCPRCPFPSRFVPPNGPQPARILAVGEGPARWELRRGYPFAGESGDELDDHYLPLAGLRRPHIRVTNARLCAAPGLANPSKAEAAACSARHLGTELRLARPQVVLTLGAVAASLFGIGHLDHAHGVPFRGSYEHWEGWVFPVFHPAQGIRVPGLINRIRADFQALGEFLRALDQGDHAGPSDPFPAPSYQEISTPAGLTASLSARPGDPPWLAIDTESDTSRGQAGAPPWCLTYSPRPGDGYLLRATRIALLAQFNARLLARRPMVILHHALHDIPVARSMGVELPRWTDSMQMAYILQSVPMGLKALSHRLCGMPMLDFEEVVYPHARQLATAYMTDIVTEISAAWQAPHTFQSGARKGLSERRFLPATPKPVREAYNRATALLRALQGDSAPAPDGEEEDTDPWRRWDNWKDGVRETMTALAGHPLPRPSITQVPFAEALQYAVRDADATGRIYPELRRLSRGREVRKEIAL